MDSLPSAWLDAGLDRGRCAVLVAPDVPDDWEAVRGVLLDAFAHARDAAGSGRPTVVVVRNDDLLGRRGVGRSMVATALLSAARTAAIEQSKAGVPVNVLAVDDDTQPETIVRWIHHLSEVPGPTGELVHLGAGHIGKALA